MLDTIQADIKNYHYDAATRQARVDESFANARTKIAAARSEDEGLLEIAAAVGAVNDSHTRFVPPTRPYTVDYGWRMQAIGEADCFVTAVRPDSDASAKGLRAGDQLLSINGTALNRRNIEIVEYGYRLVPQSGLHLTVRSPNGTTRSLIAISKVVRGQSLITHSDVMAWLSASHKLPHDGSQYFHSDNRVLFWRLPDFIIVPSDIDNLLNRTRSYETVVLDLRGNSGGVNEALQKFVGGFFDHDIKIADLKGRESSKPQMSRSRGRRAFAGKLVVLIDSRTASAAEIFARLVQLEKRGIVIGDRSRGAVMESRVYLHAVKLDATNVALYGINVSVADLIMSDGRSLERAGVSPDEKMLPSVADIAQGRDPVLARAAHLAGIDMTPEDAAKIFPVDWHEERVPEID